MNKKAIVLYDNSEHNADLFYLGNLFTPDPFLALIVDHKKIALLSALEFTRAKTSSHFDIVLSLEDITERTKNELNIPLPDTGHIILFLSKLFKFNSILVPFDFPFGIINTLQGKIPVELHPSPLFPNREIKSQKEAELIQTANKAAAAGIKAAYLALKNSIIKKDKIYLDKKVLTSEHLKTIINSAVAQAGGVAQHTIVAAGNQACDPHCSGSGPIPPHQLIIIDVFPRMSNSGYYGDMTRTFLKGSPSPQQKKLVQAVLQAQKLAIEKLQPNIDASIIHNTVSKHFQDNNFKTEKIQDTHQGFFHSTGHGLGLDLHEYPRISKKSIILKPGNVFTIEPGLYYPGLGACRIEDVLWLTNSGYQMLSSYHYSWHIK